MITLHCLWVENRSLCLINLKNLICVNIVKYQVKFCILLDFVHIFLTNLASTGGPHGIIRRPACGPRAGQHWIRTIKKVKNSNKILKIFRFIVILCNHFIILKLFRTIKGFILYQIKQTALKSGYNFTSYGKFSDTR